MPLQVIEENGFAETKHLSLNKQRCRMLLPGPSSFPSPLCSLRSVKVTEEPLGSTKNFLMLGNQISSFFLISAEQGVEGWERGKMWLWHSACPLWPWWKFTEPCLSYKLSCCVILTFSSITSCHFLPLMQRISRTVYVPRAGHRLSPCVHTRPGKAQAEGS